ncbi:DinB family protein [Catenovulum sediminis]|uniref:DinB family protein n=1 Tax=Catenovulum sediminis TaxID=1740262 RepID=UPI00117F2270|nr:DinB family protein [Catenovulum sediminis]
MYLKSNFELMADYNQWMNQNIYLAASNLRAGALSKNRGAFFGSIIGTLNHVLVGDIIWLKRFAEHPSELNSLNYVRTLDKPKSLDTILHHEFEALEITRSKIDLIIKDFTQELSNDVLSSNLTYSNTKGEMFNKNLGYLVQHFFNHQTHHRGQISTLLNQVGIDLGVTDLVARIPSE